MNAKSEALLASEYRMAENLRLGLSKHRHQGESTAFPKNGRTSIWWPASLSARKRPHQAVVAVGFSLRSIAGTAAKIFKALASYSIQILASSRPLLQGRFELETSDVRVFPETCGLGVVYPPRRWRTTLMILCSGVSRVLCDSVGKGADRSPLHLTLGVITCLLA